MITVTEKKEIDMMATVLNIACQNCNVENIDALGPLCLEFKQKIKEAAEGLENSLSQKSGDNNGSPDTVN